MELSEEQIYDLYSSAYRLQKAMHGPPQARVESNEEKCTWVLKVINEASSRFEGISERVKKNAEKRRELYLQRYLIDHD